MGALAHSMQPPSQLGNQDMLQSPSVRVCSNGCGWELPERRKGRTCGRKGCTAANPRKTMDPNNKLWTRDNESTQDNAKSGRKRKALAPLSQIPIAQDTCPVAAESLLLSMQALAEEVRPVVVPLSEAEVSKSGTRSHAYLRFCFCR